MIGQYVTVHGDVISHVNITHVMVEDGGEYSCIAENRAGKVSHSARLNIYGTWFNGIFLGDWENWAKFLHEMYLHMCDWNVYVNE